jgi:bifunctional DNA-binding transcriptional regulator/antitoxin component of YhaV-PrlF toxin-antitoxin module
MITLTVTARGQIMIRKEVLQHLGIQPGRKLEVDLIPGGKAQLKAAQGKGSFSDLKGALQGKTNGKRLSIEQLNQAIADAGASAGAGQR